MYHIRIWIYPRCGIPSNIFLGYDFWLFGFLFLSSRSSGEKEKRCNKRSGGKITAGLWYRSLESLNWCCMNGISCYDAGSVWTEWVNWELDENELEMFMERSEMRCPCVRSIALKLCGRLRVIQENSEGGQKWWKIWWVEKWGKAIMDPLTVMKGNLKTWDMKTCLLWLLFTPFSGKDVQSTLISRLRVAKVQIRMEMTKEVANRQINRNEDFSYSS